MTCELKCDRPILKTDRKRHVTRVHDHESRSTSKIQGADEIERRPIEWTEHTMKILYSFPHQIGSPGIGTTAYMQARSLHELGHEVTVISARKTDDSVNQWHRTTLSWGRVYLPQRSIGKSRARRLHDRRVARYLKENARDIDLVHCWPSGSLTTLKVASDIGVPTLLERPSAETGYVFRRTRDECERLNLQLNSNHYASFDQVRLTTEWQEFEAATVLLCPSDFVLQTFVDCGFDESRLVRHTYGYDPEVFFPPSREPDPFSAIYVGEANPLKGLHIALESWLTSEISESGTFTIVGNVVPEYERALASQLRHFSVQAVGFSDDVAALLRSSNILIHPSLAEGSALVIFEGRASGCLPLISDASGAVGTHGVDCLIHPAGDVAALRDHLNLVSRRGISQDLRAASQVLSRKQTWRHAAERLSEVYEDVLSTWGTC